MSTNDDTTGNSLRPIRSGIARVLVASVAMLTVTAVAPDSRYARIVTLCALLFFVTGYWVATSSTLPEQIGGSRRFRLAVRVLLILASGAVILYLRPDDGKFWNAWLLARGTMESVQTVGFLVYLRQVLIGVENVPLSRHCKLLIVVASIGYILTLAYVAMAVLMGFENPFETLPSGEEQVQPGAIITLIPLFAVLTVLSIWNFIFLVRTYWLLSRRVEDLQTEGRV